MHNRILFSIDGVPWLPAKFDASNVLSTTTKGLRSDKIGRNTQITGIAHYNDFGEIWRVPLRLKMKICVSDALDMLNSRVLR
jgi:hypothetical protein